MKTAMKTRLTHIALIVGLVAAVGAAFAIKQRSEILQPSNGPKNQDTAAGSSFAPTVLNNFRPANPAPEGMVWIPGGEFSMGSTVETESLCGQPGVTRDALPVHRVYVDGFWMDSTEVTNDQLPRPWKISSQARPFSLRLPARFRSIISISGGATKKGRTGVIPKDRGAI
jgi:hypothetical protein